MKIIDFLLPGIVILTYVSYCKVLVYKYTYNVYLYIYFAYFSIVDAVYLIVYAYCICAFQPVYMMYCMYMMYILLYV